MSGQAGAVPVALTIAGSDSGAGAGIQADLKTFAALGVYGTCAITALTAQNTRGVQGVLAIEPGFIGAQIASVLADFAVAAIKTGMLATAPVIAEVARALGQNPAIPLVLDPVMVATSGDPLITDDAVAALRRALLPRARVITPNLPEAARLLGEPVAASEAAMRAQAAALKAMTPGAVLIKGGHGGGEEAVDVLCDEAGTERLARPRIATRHTHGTGCTLSAAIAAGLAKGLPLRAAIASAKDYLWHALRGADRVAVGHGRGPVDHFHAWRAAP